MRDDLRGNEGPFKKKVSILNHTAEEHKEAYYYMGTMVRGAHHWPTVAPAASMFLVLLLVYGYGDLEPPCAESKHA